MNGMTDFEKRNVCNASMRDKSVAIKVPDSAIDNAKRYRLCSTEQLPSGNFRFVIKGCKVRGRSPGLVGGSDRTDADGFPGILLQWQRKDAQLNTDALASVRFGKTACNWEVQEDGSISVTTVEPLQKYRRHLLTRRAVAPDRKQDAPANPAKAPIRIDPNPAPAQGLSVRECVLALNRHKDALGSELVLSINDQGRLEAYAHYA